MREPPDLAGDAIVGALQTGFGIRVAGLSFLPVGNDADSWAFRVEAADGPDWFLKVRSGTGAMPGAAVPAYLHRRGTPGVLAPVPTHLTHCTDLTHRLPFQRHVRPTSF